MQLAAFPRQLEVMGASSGQLVFMGVSAVQLVGSAGLPEDLVKCPEQLAVVAKPFSATCIASQARITDLLQHWEQGAKQVWMGGQDDQALVQDVPGTPGGRESLLEASDQLSIKAMSPGLKIPELTQNSGISLKF